jgi:hypothetical protein
MGDASVVPGFFLTTFQDKGIIVPMKVTKIAVMMGVAALLAVSSAQALGGSPSGTPMTVGPVWVLPERSAISANRRVNRLLPPRHPRRLPPSKGRVMPMVMA